MIVACDTSALGKLLVEEPESEALRVHLSGAAEDTFVVVSLAVTELRRLAMRLEIDDRLVSEVLGPFTVVRTSEVVLELAGRLRHRTLRTLDAVHVAGALAMGAGCLLTYDQRQASACTAEGLAVRSPA